MEKATLIQVFVSGFSDNFAYVVFDRETRLGAVIDACGSVHRIIDVLEKEKVKVQYVITTHAHPDHTDGNNEIIEKYNAKLVAHEMSPLKADIKVKDDDVIKLGESELKIIYTPGHSPDSICILIEDSVITGDTLFVGAIGRADLLGSDIEELYNSLQKLMSLDENIKVYPGHDYGRSTSSTIGNEKRTNPYLLCRNRDDFIRLRL